MQNPIIGCKTSVKDSNPLPIFDEHEELEGWALAPRSKPNQLQSRKLGVHNPRTNIQSAHYSAATTRFHHCSDIGQYIQEYRTLHHRLQPLGVRTSMIDSLYHSLGPSLSNSEVLVLIQRSRSASADACSGLNPAGHEEFRPDSSQTRECISVQPTTRWASSLLTTKHPLNRSTPQSRPKKDKMGGSECPSAQVTTSRLSTKNFLGRSMTRNPQNGLSAYSQQRNALLSSQLYNHPVIADTANGVRQQVWFDTQGRAYVSLSRRLGSLFRHQKI